MTYRYSTMDGERVLREVQCPVIPSDSSRSTCIEMKENSPPGEWTRYKQAYHSCVQRNSGLVEAMEAQRVLVNKLSTFQSMKVSPWNLTVSHSQLNMLCTCLVV